MAQLYKLNLNKIQLGNTSNEKTVLFRKPSKPQPNVKVSCKNLGIGN